MNNFDRVRLQHMLEAACEALSFVEGRNKDDLSLDRMLLLSLVKEIEIIGEAAGKVSAECRARMPGIPWAGIVGIRNRLIHAYFDWNVEIIWATLTSNLPKLVDELRRVLQDVG
jgi:uncharacterized protein with HEPN domain